MLGTITLPELPFDEVATALGVLVGTVVAVGFGVWAGPYAISFGKRVWAKITGR